MVRNFLDFTWRVCAGFLWIMFTMILVGLPLVYMKTVDDRIAEAIKAGMDPMEAKCAYSFGDHRSHSLCAQYYGKRIKPMGLL